MEKKDRYSVAIPENTRGRMRNEAEGKKERKHALGRKGKELRLLLGGKLGAKEGEGIKVLGLKG